MCTFCVGNGTLSQLFEEDFLLPHTVYLRRKVKIHEAIIVLMSLLGDVAIMVEYAGTHHPAWRGPVLGRKGLLTGNPAAAHRGLAPCSLGRLHTLQFFQNACFPLLDGI